jgi:hypothetical protein
MSASVEQFAWNLGLHPRLRSRVNGQHGGHPPAYIHPSSGIAPIPSQRRANARAAQLEGSALADALAVAETLLCGDGRRRRAGRAIARVDAGRPQCVSQFRRARQPAQRRRWIGRAGGDDLIKPQALEERIYFQRESQPFGGFYTERFVPPWREKSALMKEKRHSATLSSRSSDSMSGGTPSARIIKPLCAPTYVPLPLSNDMHSCKRIIIRCTAAKKRALE